MESGAQHNPNPKEKRMARRIIDFVNVAAGTILGLFVLVFVIRHEGVSAFKVWNLKLLNFILVAAVILVIVNAWALVRMWRAGFFRRKLRVVSDEGANELSLSSLEALLVKELKTQADVVDPKVTLESKGDGHPLLCHLKYKLKRQENVIGRADELKKLVKAAFLRLLPAGVEIAIVGEVHDLVSDAPAAEKSGEFAGPVYPPDGGD
jgi:signal transduction histidine kinase